MSPTRWLDRARNVIPPSVNDGINALLSTEVAVIAAVVVSAAVLGFALFRAVKPRQRWRARYSRRVLDRVRSFEGSHSDKRMLAYLRRIDPFTFEELLLTLFEQAGCRVKRNRRYTGDGGVDGRVRVPGGPWMLIQAKRYTGHLRYRDARAFGELCQKKRMPGLLIHTGREGAATRDLVRIHPGLASIGPQTLIPAVHDPDILHEKAQMLAGLQSRAKESTRITQATID